MIEDSFITRMNMTPGTTCLVHSSSSIIETNQAPRGVRRQVEGHGHVTQNYLKIRSKPDSGFKSDLTCPNMSVWFSLRLHSQFLQNMFISLTRPSVIPTVHSCWGLVCWHSRSGTTEEFINQSLVHVLESPSANYSNEVFKRCQWVLQNCESAGWRQKTEVLFII